MGQLPQAQGQHSCMAAEEYQRIPGFARAACRCDVDALREIFSAGVDVDHPISSDRHTALQLCCGESQPWERQVALEDRIACVEFLLANGASPNAGAPGNPGQGNYAAAKAGLVGMTKSLAKELGAKVPLESQRGYHVTIADPGISLNRNVMAVEQNIMVNPMSMGLRLAGTVEFAGLKAAPQLQRLELGLDGTEVGDKGAAGLAAAVAFLESARPQTLYARILRANAMVLAESGGAGAAMVRGMGSHSEP